MFKDEDDPRITKVGKFIRKTSIDELPSVYQCTNGRYEPCWYKTTRQLMNLNSTKGITRGVFQ